MSWADDIAKVEIPKDKALELLDKYGALIPDLGGVFHTLKLYVVERAPEIITLPVVVAKELKDLFATGSSEITPGVVD